MKKLILFTLSLILLQIQAHAGTSNVLFSTFTGVVTTPFSVSSQNFTDAGIDFRSQGADDFTVTGNGWIIDQVAVQGTYFGGAGPAQSVNIYILGNSSNLPDTTNLSAGAIYAAENLSYTDTASGDFQISLPGSGVTLLPGTYWLVVQANMEFLVGGQWGWIESASAPNSGTSIGFESTWFQSMNAFIPPPAGGAATCVDAWGRRITDCNMTESPLNPPSEFDLAFELRGTVLVPGVTVTPTTLNTSEAGTTDSFTVVLTAPPSGGNTVSVPIDLPDLTEGSVSHTSLTFNATDWNIPKTVTVTPVDDALSDGDILYTLNNGPTSSGDLAYDGLSVNAVNVTNDDNEVASTLFSNFSGTAPAAFAVSSQNFFDFSVQTQGADDFTIPGNGWTIRQVSVQGQYSEFQSGGPTGPAQSVNVYILGNSGGLPDTTNLPAGSIYVAEGLSYTDIGSGDFKIPLPGSGVTLPPGTYWLVVQANMSTATGGHWGWNESAAVLNSGIPTGFESAWFQTANVIAPANGGAFTCVSNWGRRVTDCNVTVPADPNPPAEFDLAFELSGIPLAPSIIVNPTSMVTSESGAINFFEVVLTAPPTSGNTVTVPIGSPDATEGSVSDTSLSFNAANWNIPQTVTVTGLDDGIADGNVQYSLVNGPSSSGDVSYSGLAVNDVGIANFDNDVAGISVSPLSGLQISEDGTVTATFDVNSNTPPTDDVMVPFSFDNSALASLSTLSIALPSGSTAPQTVTVTGIDDDLDDSDQPFTIITGDPASVGDAVYDSLIAADVADVSAKRLDNDIAGFNVSVVGGAPLTTGETGAMGIFNVVLTSEPTHDVTITLFCSDISEGLVSPASLTFNPGNWDTPQPVTVTGQDDGMDDGDIAYSLVLQPASSMDSRYNGIDPSDIDAINIDDTDTAGITVTPINGLTTTEAGGTDTFTVVLDSQPQYEVRIPFTTSDNTEGLISSNGVTQLQSLELTFTPADWNVAQTITVHGQDDPVVDADSVFTIQSGPATSTITLGNVSKTSADYNNRAVTNVEVTNFNNDTLHTVGGTVTGLAAGNSVVLQNNIGDNLNVTGNGSFTFSTALINGSAFAVTVLTQPTTPSQTCTVTNGSGTLAGANINAVTVTCSTNTHTIGGSVTGLAAGNSVVLQNNAGDNLTVAANSNFTFSTAIADGSTFAVTVLAQPTTPNQTCSVTNGNGTLAGANINTVTVTCSTNTHTIGGSVTGLATGNSVVLQNNLGDNLILAANSNFTFSAAIADGSTFAVTVLAQPTTPIQVCSVTNGNGILAGANVTNISVICNTNTTPILTFTGFTATGTGTATATIDSGGGANCGFDPAGTGFVATNTISPVAPTSNQFLHSLFRFRLTQCNPGSTVAVTLTLPGAAFPIGTEFWKFGPATAGAMNSWFQPVANIDTASKTITFSVVNNGVGDSDPDVNVIVDPVGVAFIPAPNRPIPTLSEWAMIILSLMLGMMVCLKSSFAARRG